MRIIPLVMASSQHSPGDKWRLSIDATDRPAIAILEHFTDDPIDSAGNYLPGPGWSYVGDVTAFVDEVGVTRLMGETALFDDKKALGVLHREMTSRGAPPMQPAVSVRRAFDGVIDRAVDNAHASIVGKLDPNQGLPTHPDRVRWTEMAGQLRALANMIEEGRAAPFSTLDVTIERGNGPGQEHVEIGRKWKLEATTLSRPDSPMLSFKQEILGQWIPPARPIDRRTAVAIARAAAAKHNVNTTSTMSEKWPPEWVMTAILEAGK
jgi:hypothetical protein